MKVPSLAYLVLLPMTSVLLFGQPRSNLPQKGQSGPISVIYEIVQGRDTYKVNSRSVTSEELLNVLATQKGNRKPGRAIVVLIHEDVSLRKINNLDGIIGKVGFKNVRYFYYTKDRDRMLEFRFGPKGLPFSLNPDLDQAHESPAN